MSERTDSDDDDDVDDDDINDEDEFTCHSEIPVLKTDTSSGKQ